MLTSLNMYIYIYIYIYIYSFYCRVSCSVLRLGLAMCYGFICSKVEGRVVSYVASLFDFSSGLRILLIIMRNIWCERPFRIVGRAVSFVI